ncbi:long-chain fatty acid--CoA ligase, partial [Streptomyces sp. NPDC127044]
MTTYADRPWVALLNDAQSGPVSPADSLVHALRGAVADAPDRAPRAVLEGRGCSSPVEHLFASRAVPHPAPGVSAGDA